MSMQQDWLVYWEQPKSVQTYTQANILATYPLTTARDKHVIPSDRSQGQTFFLLFFSFNLLSTAVFSLWFHLHTSVNTICTDEYLFTVCRKLKSWSYPVISRSHIFVWLLQRKMWLVFKATSCFRGCRSVEISPPVYWFLIPELHGWKVCLPSKDEIHN